MMQTPPPKPRSRLFPKILLVILLPLALWGVIVAWQIASYAQRDETAPADVAIVLGAGTRRETPSPVFRERIDHAINLYRSGVVRAIILTGGVGNGRTVADSEIARDYALEEGVPAEVIYIEMNSETTLENLQEARTIMQDEGFESALVVSDPLHLYRALNMAGGLGLDAHPSPTPTSRINSWWANLFFLVREVPLVMQYSFFGGGDG
jgi:uncharacterized SAM-binding protein YcdF (DUF218 family)